MRVAAAFRRRFFCRVCVCVGVCLNMKVKVIKKFVLTEETLDKDIDAFIEDAKRGAYQYDYKHGMDGLKIIRQYFKLLQKEFESKNYALCRACYKKLLFFLFAMGEERDCFNYEDILGRTKLDFNKIVADYFTCLLAECSVEELFKEYVEYVKSKKDYDFKGVPERIYKRLSEHDLKGFEELLMQESGKISEKDYELCDIPYFLLELAKTRKDKPKYLDLVQRFAHVIGEDPKELMGEYDCAG